jgi:sulfur carrier protein ThiS
MQLSIRFYSVARHRDGRIVDGMELDLPDHSRVSDLLAALDINPEFEPVISVNGVIADEETLLGAGDRVAIIPAVAGG